MTERQAADAFVQSRIEAALVDADIEGWAVYPDIAPDGTLPPYVVYGSSGGIEPLSNGRERKWTTLTYTIRAVARGNVSATDPIEGAINAALDGFFQIARGGYLFDATRMGSLSLVTPRQGRTYRYAGGRYQIVVRRILQP